MNFEEVARSGSDAGIRVSQLVRQEVRREGLEDERREPLVADAQDASSNGLARDLGRDGSDELVKVGEVDLGVRGGGGHCLFLGDLLGELWLEEEKEMQCSASAGFPRPVGATCQGEIRHDSTGARPSTWLLSGGRNEQYVEGANRLRNVRWRKRDGALYRQTNALRALSRNRLEILKR